MSNGHPKRAGVSRKRTKLALKTSVAVAAATAMPTPASNALAPPPTVAARMPSARPGDRPAPGKERRGAGVRPAVAADDLTTRWAATVTPIPSRTVAAATVSTVAIERWRVPAGTTARALATGPSGDASHATATDPKRPATTAPVGGS